jgi:hypothetical protein
MKLTRVAALCLLAFNSVAVLAATPASGGSDAAQLDALKAQVAALQSQVDALRASIATVSAAAPAPAAAAPATPPVVLTNDDAAQMREQLNNMTLKVDSLEDAATTGPLAGLSITGYLDPVYLYNRAQHSSGFMFVNHDPGVYDYYNSTIGDLYLDIKKTFGVGPMAPAAEIVIEPNRGFGSVLSNEHGALGNNILTQADVTVPLNATTTFATGLMTSLAGYEGQPSNQMFTLTHGLLYDFSEPGNMIGIGLKGANATYNHLWQVLFGNEQMRTAGAIVNAANNTTKSNWTPTLSARFDDVLSTALDIGISAAMDTSATRRRRSAWFATWKAT